MNQIAIWCGIIAVRFGVLASVNISWSSDEHCGIAVAQISGKRNVAIVIDLGQIHANNPALADAAPALYDLGKAPG